MGSHVVTVLGAVLVGAALVWSARAYHGFRSLRLVSCPQTGQPASVRIATWPAVLAAVFRRQRLRLSSCSHWRERHDCGQTCLRQIETAPEACLLRNILAKWYEGKSCACCGRPIGEIAWTLHKPCLISPEPRIYQWNDIQPDQIPCVLETFGPVCWSCNVAETHTW